MRLILVCILLCTAVLTVSAEKKDLARLPETIQSFSSLIIPNAERSVFFEQIMPSLPQEIEKLTDITGIDIMEDVSIISVGSTASPAAADRQNGGRQQRMEPETTEQPSQAEETCILLHGKFKQEELIEGLHLAAKEDEPEILVTQHLKMDIISFRKGSLAMAMIDRKIAAIATPETIVAVIETVKRKQKSSSTNRDLTEVIPPISSPTIFWSVSTGYSPQDVSIDSGRGPGGSRMRDAMVIMNLGRLMRGYDSLGVEIRQIRRIEAGGRPVDYMVFTVHQRLKDVNTANQLATALRQAVNIQNTGIGQRAGLADNEMLNLLKNVQTATSGRILKLTFTVKLEELEQISNLIPNLIPKKLIRLPQAKPAETLEENEVF